MSSAAPRRLLLVLLGAAFYAAMWAHPDWMSRVGAGNSGVWFLDTHAVLASSDADALGLNPYAPNPLDFHHQRHVYSGWWLDLHRIGLTRADYIWVGAALGFTFLGVAALQLKVRSPGEVLWSAAFLASPALLLGFNRGNADLLIFLVLAFTIPSLQSSRPAVRWLAVAALLAGTALKFYPVVGGVVLLAPGRPRQERWWQIGVFLATSAAALLHDAALLRGYAADPLVLPPLGYHVFGAGVLAQMLGVKTAATVVPALVAGGVAAAYAWRRMPAWPGTAASRSETLYFVLGATLITGCYFATVNYSYRLVFAVWMAPLLWQAWRDNGWTPEFRIMARAAGTLLMVELWLDAALRLPLGTPAAADPVPAGAVAIIAVEQVLAFALAVALVVLLAPWVRDQLPRAFAAGRADTSERASA